MRKIVTSMSNCWVAELQQLNGRKSYLKGWLHYAMYVNSD